MKAILFTMLGFWMFSITAQGADRFRVLGFEGAVKITGESKETRSLKVDEVIQEGTRLFTGHSGRVILLRVGTMELYEVTPNSDLIVSLSPLPPNDTQQVYSPEKAVEEIRQTVKLSQFRKSK